MLTRFHRIPERNGQTDGRTDGQTGGQNCYISIARQCAIKISLGFIESGIDNATFSAQIVKLVMMINDVSHAKFSTS